MKKNLLQEGRVIDYYVIYLMAKKFITPFRKWQAYDLGLIDDRGRRTKKSITTKQEKSAYTLLDRLVRKIRVTVGDKWFLKMTLTWLLLKEDFELAEKPTLLENNFKTSLSDTEYVSMEFIDDIDSLSFFLTSYLWTDGKELITSRFGSDNITKINNEDLFEKLNSIINGIKTPGYREINIYDDIGEPSLVKISYGDFEVKIESVPTLTLNLGKFYTVFKDEEQKQEFIETWNKEKLKWT